MSSSSDTRLSAHPPSQFVLDGEGNKWRLCAGAAVLNSKNELLIGERLGKTGSWQAPQGGVDGRVSSYDDDNDESSGEDETVAEAAVRELYEEVGLENGRHVLSEEMRDGDPSSLKCRYSTAGTGSWLERSGFSGQELHWTLFRCSDAKLECNPSLACCLSGLNGESPEFSAVRWASIDWVVENVWKAKVGPYEVLRKGSLSAMRRWEERCAALEFTGRWSRDAGRSSGIAAGLVSRGNSEEYSKIKALEPYIQSWERAVEDSREWIVTTFNEDGSTPRRTLRYPLGDFEEKYEGKSKLFGQSNGGGGVVKRNCFYLAESDSDSKIAHVTISETPRGVEESRRYMQNGELILRRTFWTSWEAKSGAVSTEIFERS